MKKVHGHFVIASKYLGLMAALVMVWIPAFGHDATEITTKAYLRTNCLEMRVTVAAQTAIALMQADGHQVLALSSPDDLERARPFLETCAAGLFQISAAGRQLVASETNVALSVEDHLEIKLIYPRPGPGPLRFDAVHLKKLPINEPYGALLTVVDLGNNVFLSQKLLTAGDPVAEVDATAPSPPANSSAPVSRPQTETKPIRASSFSGSNFGAETPPFPRWALALRR